MDTGQQGGIVETCRITESTAAALPTRTSKPEVLSRRAALQPESNRDLNLLPYDSNRDPGQAGPAVSRAEPPTIVPGPEPEAASITARVSEATGRRPASGPGPGLRGSGY